MNYTKLAKRVLILIAAISLLAAWNLQNVKFDYNFERFFPIGDPELDFLLEFREQFSPDNDFTLIAIENEAGVFNQEFLEKVDAFCLSLDSVPLVTAVNGPTRLKYPIMGPLGPISASYIHVDKPELYKRDSLRVFQAPHLLGTFFSETRPAISIIVDAEHFLSKEKCDELEQNLSKALEPYAFDKVIMSGRIIGQKYFIERTQTEMGLFIGLGFFILAAFLWFSFRTSWGVWVPLLVVGLSATWLISFMQFTGKYVDPLSTLLPIILFVVGVSDIVHILSKYLEELRWGKPKLEALRLAFKEVGMATFLTSITTAIGFLTLLTANILPLKEFGIFMSVGVMIAFLLAFSLLPAVLILRKKPPRSDKKHTQLFWYPVMSKLFRFVIKRRKAIVAGGAFLILISAWGISMIRIDNHLLQDLSEDDPFRQDFEYFEKHFAGIRPFEMALMTKEEKGLLSFESANEINKLEQYLIEHYEMGFVASPLTAIKMANQATHGGRAEYYRFPDSEKAYKSLRSTIKRFEKSKLMAAVLSEDGKEGRISSKIADKGAYNMKKLDAKLFEFIELNIDPSYLETRITGTANLLDKNSEGLAFNMLNGLLIAFLVVGAIMGIVYRSVKFMLISLIPNILPLVLVAAIMGFFGIDLNVSTSIFFTIAFGIAVDDTIHFMSKLRLEMLKNKGFLYAIKRTFLSTGKAIIVTSIILCSGFIALVFSSFASTFYVGLLVSLTLLFAVIADLILLPAILITFRKGL